MSGKLFVHIGLPKTATTTLQKEFFPVLASGKIQYLGVIQPRQGNVQGHIYKKFCEAVYTGSTIAEVRLDLADMLNAGTTAILSEEMFTVSSAGATWRVKLKHLAEILHGLDYVLILTVREPCAALFSYYVEINETFSREKRSFLELAREDERMHIFHYQKLTDEMLQYFPSERVFVKKFEDIVAGRLDDLCHLISTGKHDWPGLKLNKHNEKKQVGDVIYTGKHFTLADIGRRLVIMLGIIDSSLVIQIKKALAFIVRRLDGVALFKKKIVRPSTEEMVQLKNYLRKETIALEKHFRITYE